MISAHQYPGPQWRKSSYSGNNQGECLEVADGFDHVPVRDSKNPNGPVLQFEAAAFGAFVAAVQNGTFSA